MSKSRKNDKKKSVKVQDLAPKKDPKGGTLKTRHDTVKNSISNVR